MALDFNGSSQYLSIANPILTAVPITMACWFNSDSIVASQELMCIGDTAGTAERFTLAADGTRSAHIIATTRSGGVNGLAETTTSFTAGTWFHACGVFTSTASRTAYINGGSSATETTNLTPTSLDTTRIGRRVNNTSTDYFDGRIAEAAIWNVALTAADVASLAAGINPLAIRPENLVAYWPIIGKYSPEIDIIGKFDLTVNAGPLTAPHPRIFKQSRKYTPPRKLISIHNVDSDLFINQEFTNIFNLSRPLDIEMKIVSASILDADDMLVYPSVITYIHPRIYGYNTRKFNPRFLNTGNIHLLLGDAEFIFDEAVSTNLILGEAANFDIVSEGTAQENITRSFNSDLLGTFDSQVSANNILGAVASYNILVENPANLSHFQSILGNFSVITEQSVATNRGAALLANYDLVSEIISIISRNASIGTSFDFVINKYDNIVRTCSAAVVYDIVMEATNSISKKAAIAADYSIVSEVLGNTNLIASLAANNSLLFQADGTFGGIALLLVDINSIFDSQASLNTIKGFAPSFDIKTESMGTTNITYRVGGSADIVFDGRSSTSLILGVNAQYGIITEITGEFGSRIFVSADMSGIIDSYIEAAKTAGLSSEGEVVFLGNSTFNLARPLIADLNITLQKNAALNKSANVSSTFSVLTDSYFRLVAGVSLIVDANIDYAFELSPRINLVTAGQEIMFVYDVTYYMKPVDEVIYSVVEKVEKTLPVVHDLFTTFRVRKVQE